MQREKRKAKRMENLDGLQLEEDTLGSVSKFLDFEGLTVFLK